MARLKNKPIPLAIINRAIKSICKIKPMDINHIFGTGTGFFLRIFSRKYLITCSYITQYENKKENTEIVVEIYNKELIKLSFKDRFIKCLEHPKNILAIEIKDSDFKSKDIEFLDYDQNYIKDGYSIYEYCDVFSLNYAHEDLVCSSGNIKGVNGFEFGHSISTEQGSSGSPIILFSDRSMMNVIGIHTGFNYHKGLNRGVFIGEIIKELQKNINLSKQDTNNIFEYYKNSNKKIYNNIDNNLDIYIFNNDITNLNNNNNMNFNANNFNKPINLNINLTKNENKDITNFSIKSTDQLFNSNICCRNKDIFNTIMNIIVEKEPLLADKIGYFMCNGTKVNEYKSIKDNGIKNNNVVLMYTPD